MTTEAGKRTAESLRKLLPHMPLTWEGIDNRIDAIEAEAVAAERAHWHRTPGTYRTDDATEVVVDLPESLSWLEDEFPDEVNAIVAAERARIVAEVKALPTLVLPTGTYVDVEDVFDAVGP